MGLAPFTYDQVQQHEVDTKIANTRKGSVVDEEDDAMEGNSGDRASPSGGSAPAPQTILSESHEQHKYSDQEIQAGKGPDNFDYGATNQQVDLTRPFAVHEPHAAQGQYSPALASAQDPQRHQERQWYDNYGTLYTMTDRGLIPSPAALPLSAAPPTVAPISAAPPGVMEPRQPLSATESCFHISGYDQSVSYRTPLPIAGASQYHSTVVPTTPANNRADPAAHLASQSYVTAPPLPRTYSGPPGFPPTHQGLPLWYPYGYRYYPYMPSAALYDPQTAIRPDNPDTRLQLGQHFSQREEYDVTNASAQASASSEKTALADSSPESATLPVLGMGQLSTDAQGIPWLRFEYSRDRVQCSYHIRCDIDNIDESLFSETFRNENCIYPRAMVPPEEYRGHRQRYETVCNQIGWRLAFRNPAIQNRRGLIQRAVDTYRNSSQDVSTRSRRARRLMKQQEKERKRQMRMH